LNDTKECVVCGTEIEKGKVCDKEYCRERYNKIQKTKSKNKGGIYKLSKEDRENLLKRKNTAVDYLWSDNSKDVCLSENVLELLEVIDNQTRLSSDDIKTHGPFAIKFKLKDYKDAITVPDVYIDKYNLIVTVKDEENVNNIEEYRVILNQYSFNYIQISNKKDIQEFPNTLKKIERAMADGNRYITPPKIMDKMISESKVKSLNPESLDLRYMLLPVWEGKVVGVLLSRDVLLTDKIYHTDGEDLYETELDSNIKNNALIIDLKDYSINLFNIRESLDLMGNPTMVDIMSYHLGIPLEYTLKEKIQEILNQFGGMESLKTFEEYSKEFDDMMQDLIDNTERLTIGYEDGKLRINKGGEPSWEIED